MEVKGLECDVCHKMFHTQDRPADMRIKVVVTTNQDHVEGTFDLCSAECHHKLTLERKRAAKS